MSPSAFLFFAAGGSGGGGGSCSPVFWGTFGRKIGEVWQPPSLRLPNGVVTAGPRRSSLERNAKLFRSCGLSVILCTCCSPGPTEHSLQSVASIRNHQQSTPPPRLNRQQCARTTGQNFKCMQILNVSAYFIPGDESNISDLLLAAIAGQHKFCVTPTILSDLFGPYLIEKNWNEDSTFVNEQETAILSKGESIHAHSLEYSAVEDQLLSKWRRKKTKIHDNSKNLYMGMVTLGDDDRQWEVWLHEQCIIWTAGVFITGGRICGLQDAVWDATKSICDTCGLTGANIGCIKRGCKSVAHYCCALTSGWLLDTNHFLPKCNAHENT
ncbi:hypothetical protein TSAR_013797 [Trichomalopsis sarcophagae]|uniref:PHD-type domain-containing protein n=1 Tax=Trichomalopsis sarcophagae TaxID=543379 RepID=A0A232ELJ0_9HYME|nr:hypothetical protein TSAR_013797 [Trichomalopsis sarcophagae]